MTKSQGAGSQVVNEEAARHVASHVRESIQSLIRLFVAASSLLAFVDPLIEARARSDVPDDDERSGLHDNFAERLREFCAMGSIDAPTNEVDAVFVRCAAQVVFHNGVAHTDPFRLARRLLDDLGKELSAVRSVDRFKDRDLPNINSPFELELLAEVVRNHCPASRDELIALNGVIDLSISRIGTGPVTAKSGRTRLQVNQSFARARIDDGDWFKIKKTTHRLLLALIRHERVVRARGELDTAGGLPATAERRDEKRYWDTKIPMYFLVHAPGEGKGYRLAPEVDGFIVTNKR